MLEAVPSRYGLVFGAWRHFLPRPGEGCHFAERMVYRLSAWGPRTGPADPFHPQVKVAHRACPDVVVGEGNHDVRSPGVVLLRGWYPLEVLHFPIRSFDQSASKYRSMAQAIRLGLGRLPLHVQVAE